MLSILRRSLLHYQINKLPNTLWEDGELVVQSVRVLIEI